MVSFLAGTITENTWDGQGFITEQYGFCTSLKKYWKNFSRCLYVCSDPSDYNGNDAALLYYRDSFTRSGFSFSAFDLVEYRYLSDFTYERLSSYDVIILGSGRVPLQHSFLNELHLKEYFKSSRSFSDHGIVIGISAGALNCAVETYNWPEESGDTLVSRNQLFYEGLGLTKTQVLPHFQARYDMYVDGRHLYNDITVRDSYGHTFLALPDYSFVLTIDGQEQIHGPHSYYINGYFCDAFHQNAAA